MMMETQWLLGAIGTLAGAVTFLYMKIQSELSECKADRKALYEKVFHQQAEITEIWKNLPEKK